VTKQIQGRPLGTQKVVGGGPDGHDFSPGFDSSTFLNQELDLLIVPAHDVDHGGRDDLTSDHAAGTRDKGQASTLLNGNSGHRGDIHTLIDVLFQDAKGQRLDIKRTQAGIGEQRCSLW
jgi:hypothetical protein